jgi:hypothetical protein
MKQLAPLAFALVACAPQAPLSGVPAGKCSTARLGDFVGKPVTLGLADQALKRAGATVVRVIGPGQAVTMEYREERLNLHLDANSRVDHFTCG